jgi:hypothetical protein
VIRGSIRNLDTAYRLHGDEFMVLLPETDFVGAFVVAEKVRIGAEEVGLAAATVEMLTSVSVGLVSCPEDGTTADELMIAADRAMYQAKSLGKNQVSGNPRPRRLLYRAADEPAAPAPAVSAIPIAPAADVPADAAAVPPEVEASVEEAPPGDPPAAVESEALVAAEAAIAMPEAHHDAGEEDEPDPSEVRRHIAAASRNLDPDYQIRRAMDAFLSPTRPNGDRG